MKDDQKKFTTIKNFIKKKYYLTNYFSIFAYLTTEWKQNIPKVFKTTTYMINKNSTDYKGFINVPVDPNLISITLKEETDLDVREYYSSGSESNFQDKSKMDAKFWFKTTALIMGGIGIADDLLLDNTVKTNLKKTGLAAATILMGKIEIGECLESISHDLDSATDAYAQEKKAKNLESRNLKKILEEARLLEIQKTQVVEVVEIIKKK